MTPLTEQDIADIKADLRVERETLERRENQVAMPGMERQHQEMIDLHKAQIAKLEQQLVDG